MAEALIEFGIGETRALVIEHGIVVEAHLERADDGLRCGDVWDARLTTILVVGRRGIVRAGAFDALLEPLPPGVTEGALVRVEITREALPEAGRSRLAKARASGGKPGPAPGLITAGPDLASRLRRHAPMVHNAAGIGPDRLEAAGWSEILEAAATGHVAFAGGLLTISPTPAMTVIDVDGALLPPLLARAAAIAAGRAIRQFDIAGSIGIDFPGTDRGVRTELAALLDAELPAPFERTAVNGFGFVQIVRPRSRPSLLERVRGSPVATAALALLRAAERSQGHGGREVRAAPAVTAWLSARPALLTELERRLGTSARLHPDAALAISAGYVTARP